ncbi:MAG TPA: HEAT repeat domain-containing protein [Thermoanaerobaculia bacterium]|nr:HEAT repeat domain-containing protein [Thermoanaerobaculia bacterium]
MRSKTISILLPLLLVALFSSLPALGADQAGNADREKRAYERGTDAIEDRRWDAAERSFDQVARMGGRRADGALYWKAYAQNRQGRADEALATLADLLRDHPSSRWIGDAKALEVEIRGRVGRPVSPEDQTDEDLKLIALSSLMHGDSARAIPILEKFLQQETSPRLRERAMFVLAQSGSPKAREILGRMARGEANPDAQRHAIRLLGIHGDRDALALLESLYGSITDPEVRIEVVRALGISGQKGAILRLARSEPDPALRGEAIRQLGIHGSANELAELYRTETAEAVRKQILNALFISGASAHLADIARTEKNQTLKAEAVRKLGLTGEKKTADTLVAIYESDPSIRREVIQALFVQDNGAALVRLGRNETDVELRKEILKKLGIMSSPEGYEFLMEVLNQP